MNITQDQADALGDRRLKGFIFDGDRTTALANLRADASDLIPIPVTGGRTVVAAIVNVHPLRSYDTHSEIDSFGDRALYIDRTSGTATEMTAIELSIRNDGATGGRTHHIGITDEAEERSDEIGHSHEPGR